MFVYWANEAKNPSFEANNFKLWVRSQEVNYQDYNYNKNFYYKNLNIIKNCLPNN